MTNRKDKNWHKLVCERDNYICRICGKDYSASFFFEEDKNQYVCGHHLKSKKAYPELRHDIDNGICVDAECHLKLHNGNIKYMNS